MTPSVDRPEMPQGYGVESADRFLSWDQVEAELIDAKNYWLATVRPDGRPHVVPRWGVWVASAFWYDGSPQTRHVQNLETNSNCSLHLESGTRVVIVDGRSIVPDPLSLELATALSAEFKRKYGPEYQPEPDSWDGDQRGGMRTIRPVSALAWTNFPQDLTRFRFDA